MDRMIDWPPRVWVKAGTDLLRGGACPDAFERTSGALLERALPKPLSRRLNSSLDLLWFKLWTFSHCFQGLTLTFISPCLAEAPKVGRVMSNFCHKITSPDSLETQGFQNDRSSACFLTSSHSQGDQTRPGSSPHFQSVLLSTPPSRFSSFSRR